MSRGVMEKVWKEVKVERLAEALKVKLRSLDFILGVVRTLEAFLEGNDVSRLYLRKMALVLCRGWTGGGRLEAGRPMWRLSGKLLAHSAPAELATWLYLD